MTFKFVTFIQSSKILDTLDRWTMTILIYHQKKRYFCRKVFSKNYAIMIHYGYTEGHSHRMARMSMIGENANEYKPFMYAIDDIYVGLFRAY
jgi:hypothetical protein